MTAARVLRPAGVAERRCIARDVLGHYGSVVISAKYCCEKSVNGIPEDDIVKALKQCIDEHAALSTIVLNADTGKPQYAKIASLDLSQHLRFLDLKGQDADGNDAILELHGLAHDDNLPDLFATPPWRVCVASTGSGFWLVFSWSHSLGDGRSGYLFLSTFLKALRSASSLEEDASLKVFVNSTNELQPPFELARPTPISWNYFLKIAIKQYAPNFVSRMLGVATESPRDVWFGAEQRPELPRSGEVVRTSIRTLMVASDTAQQVLKSCRQHHVRLTGVLIQVITRALAKALHARGRSYQRFVQTTPIDLRRCIPEAMDSMGNYASGIVDTITVSPNRSGQASDTFSDQDWNAAREHTEHLAKASHTLTDHPLSLLRYLTDFRSWLLGNASKPAEASFELSNVGVFELPVLADGQQAWHVRDVVFSQSADCGGAAVNVCVSSVKGGRLSITTTWWPGMLGVDDDAAFLDQVLENVRYQLEAIE